MPVIDPRLSEEHVQNLWSEYFEKRTPRLRNELMEAYLPLVRIIAQKLFAGLPNTVEYEDLVMSGVFGLSEAIERYSLDRGVKFQNFAHFRIRGSMVDELRVQDWVPRGVRAAVKTYKQAYEEFANTFHQDPTEDDMMDLLDITRDEVREMSASLYNTSTPQSLQVSTSSDDSEGSPLQDTLRANLDVFDEVSLKLRVEGLKHHISGVVSRLKPREQLTVHLYYAQGLTLSQVGKVIGVSESRVCQIQTKALEAISAALKPSDLPPPN